MMSPVCDCGAPRSADGGDADTDGDGAADCVDACPFDVQRTSPGACGCGAPVGADGMHIVYCILASFAG